MQQNETYAHPTAAEASGFRWLRDIELYHWGENITHRRNQVDLYDLHDGGTSFTGFFDYDTFPDKEWRKRLVYEPNSLIFPRNDIRHRGSRIYKDIKNDDFRVNIDDYFGQKYSSHKGLIDGSD